MTTKKHECNYKDIWEMLGIVIFSLAVAGLIILGINISSILIDAKDDHIVVRDLEFDGLSSQHNFNQLGSQLESAVEMENRMLHTKTMIKELKLTYPNTTIFSLEDNNKEKDHHTDLVIQ